MRLGSVGAIQTDALEAVAIGVGSAVAGAMVSKFLTAKMKPEGSEWNDTKSEAYKKLPFLKTIEGVTLVKLGLGIASIAVAVAEESLDPMVKNGLVGFGTGYIVEGVSSYTTRMLNADATADKPAMFHSLGSVESEPEVVVYRSINLYDEPAREYRQSEYRATTHQETTPSEPTKSGVTFN